MAVLDKREHPYLSNLAYGLMFIAVLALVLSLLSGEIATFVVWFPLKLAFYVPLMIVATWFQVRSQRRSEAASLDP